MGRIDSLADPNMASSQSAKAAQNHVYLSGEFLPVNFRAQSREVARDVVHYVCRHENALPAASKHTIVMRNLVDDTLKNRLDLMHKMVLKLDVQMREQLPLIDTIATNMFDDQVVNWGRIVTLHAFCGYLARHCEERHIPDCSDDIAQILENIVVNRLGLWIVVNGGWNGFEQQFPAVYMWESTGIWKGIAIIALLIGAVFAFYSSVRFMGGPSP